MWLSRNVLSRVLQCSDDRSGNDVRLPLKRSPPMGNTLLRKTFIKYVPSHILGGFPCKSLSCYWLAVLSPPDSGGGPRGRESHVDIATLLGENLIILGCRSHFKSGN